MKKSKFTEAQIAFVLMQADQAPAVAEVCRKAESSTATFYNWRKRFGGMMASEDRKLRQIEEQNAKLKRLVADLSLYKAMLQGMLAKRALRSARRRQLADEVFRLQWLSRDLVPDLRPSST